MAAALKENRILTTLDVGSEYERHEVVACVAGRFLVAGNGIGADGAAALAAALKENRTLTTLNVGSEYE